MIALILITVAQGLGLIVLGYRQHQLSQRLAQFAHEVGNHRHSIRGGPEFRAMPGRGLALAGLLNQALRR
jgi:hypothetical protein